MSRLESVPSEVGCNTVIIGRFSVEQALSHSCVDRLFERLRASGKVQAADLAEWRRLLVDNYRRKYKRDGPLEEVRFNVKNNFVFTNDEPDLVNDTIYHPVEIPYEYADGAEVKHSFITPICCVSRSGWNHVDVAAIE